MGQAKKLYEREQLIGQRDHLRTLYFMDEGTRMRDFDEYMTSEEIEYRLEGIEKALKEEYGYTD